MPSLAENILLEHYSLPTSWSEYTEKDEEIYMSFVLPFLLLNANLIEKVSDDVMKEFVNKSLIVKK